MSYRYTFTIPFHIIEKTGAGNSRLYVGLPGYGPEQIKVFSKPGFFAIGENKGPGFTIYPVDAICEESGLEPATVTMEAGQIVVEFRKAPALPTAAMVKASGMVWGGHLFKTEVKKEI